ncbi:MAG: alpha-amylase family glycosyl hydrolase [Bdellovibrionales bacterium]
MAETFLWWQKGIIYQVYPRSFQDTNGDGVGDLLGVIQRLDYLSWLGVDAVWLSPIYPSPMKDFGYDVSDYCGIHPLFGTIDDFDRLVREAHARDLKVILDFVPNHTSEEHPWFKESRSSRHSPKRNWYLWQTPSREGGPPNNWLSNFGGPAWTLDPTTGEYYYHAFLPSQPDLNWRNPEVQDAMLNSMRFWLDRGVDGFRVDVIWHIIKDEHFRNNPHDPEYQPYMAPHRTLLATYNADQPEVHNIIEKMRHVLDAYRERMMVGEVYLPIERLVTYYGSEGNGAHLPFNFHLVHVPWEAREIASVVDNYYASLPEFGWPNWVLGNHDNPRIASRVGSDQERVAGMLLLTLRGTPTMYYGDEIGMQDVYIPPDRIQDPFEKNVPGMGHGRDPERTPMQWDSSPYAGFSSSSPWLPLATNSETVNVSRQREQPESTLNFYRALIQLRRREPALAVGTYKKVRVHEDVYAYLRGQDAHLFLICLNFSHQTREFQMIGNMRGRIVLSTFMDRRDETLSKHLELRGNEGLIIQVL